VISRTTKRILFLVVLSLALATGAACHRLCYVGQPYGEVLWSPNRKFKMVKDRTWSPRALARKMRGQGWGAPEGYVRVYAAAGRKVREQFMGAFDEVRPVWNHREVYFDGRGPSWRLPEDSEQ